MFRDDKIPQAKAQSAPMGNHGNQGPMPFPGNPGMTPGYQPMPGSQPGFFPGSPGMQLPGMELARAYIPIQQWGGPLFDLTKAIHVGTLFPELYRPYPY